MKGGYLHTWGEAEAMSEWSFFDPSSRKNLASAWTRDSDGMLDLASDPDRLQEPTGEGHWQVRDVVGHLVDYD